MRLLCVWVNFLGNLSLSAAPFRLPLLCYANISSVNTLLFALHKSELFFHLPYLQHHTSINTSYQHLSPIMTNLATWRDRHWSDISDRLLRLNTIDKTNLDGSLLEKDTVTGTWICSCPVLHTSRLPIPYLSTTLTAIPGARMQPA